MKQVAVISGKGGTGKTSLVASFAALAGGGALLVDADVDAANLSLITGARQLESHDFFASQLAVIDKKLCDQCDLCVRLCRFKAIDPDYSVDPVSCEGCRFCCYACPREAISMHDTLSGHWFVSETAYGVLVHARLGIAAENSGKLVTAIRSRGQELAEAGGQKYILVDGPPGIGCPVIASLSGVDAALIVTEPTVSGLHDLKRVIDLCRHLGVRPAVAINRCDLAPDQAGEIERFCRETGVLLAGKIPYDKVFVSALLAGVPVVEYAPGKLVERIASLWRLIS